MPTQASQSISPDLRSQIVSLLGRKPRGLEDVAVYGPGGEPMVIRVSSLVDGAPFPNLFWLIDPALVYRIDCDEAQLRSGKYYEVLQQRGIGGIADFGRIRCLHTWYAAHLVVPNTVGLLLDRYWADIDRAG